MNDVDRLEEIAQTVARLGYCSAPSARFLLSTIKEQEQEIERQKKLNDRLAEMYADMTGYQAYQRRHRKWALKRGRHDYNSRLLWEAIAINLGIRTEKAEAELAEYREKIVPLYDEAYARGKREAETQLADFKVAHEAYGVEAERQIDELQDELSVCKDELEKCKAAQDREG